MKAKRKIVTWVQQELPLFAQPTFDEMLANSNIRNLSVMPSRRMRSSWHVVRHPLSGRRDLVVPAAIETAPQDVKSALIEWALLPWKPRGKKRNSILKKKKMLEEHVWQFMKHAGIGARKKRRSDPVLYSRHTRGAKYDLAEIRDRLNKRYFGGGIRTAIRWGGYASTTSYQNTHEDSRGDKFNLITIAGIYNHPDVPQFAIEAVVHHEMLHIHIPSYKRNGRNIIHGPEFRRAERAFPYFKPWRKWENTCMNKLVRSLKRRRRR